MAYVSYMYRKLVEVEFLFISPDNSSILKKSSVYLWTSTASRNSLRDIALRNFRLCFPDCVCVRIRVLRPSGEIVEEFLPREGKSARSLITYPPF